MERFLKLVYIVIVALFIITMSFLGWFVMDEKKTSEMKIAELSKKIEEITLPKSDKEISTPDDVIVMREYNYTTPTDGAMKIIAFDNESKVVWTYVTDKTTLPEYTFDMLWPHYECVYSMEGNKLVIINIFNGEKRAQVEFGESERVVAAGYYKGDVYVLTEVWSEGGTKMIHTIHKVDNDGHTIASKDLDSPIYDGFDQTIEKVEITRIDETEIEIFVTRLDEKNIEYVTSRDF